MATSLKQTIATALTGAYLCLAGTVLAGHILYPPLDGQIKNRVYAQVKVRLDELDQILERNTFSDHGSLDFYDEHRRDLRRIMHQFRQSYQGRIPGLVRALTAAAVLAGALYIFAGAAWLGRRPVFKKMMIAAFSVYGVYFALYIFNASLEIQFLDRTSVELWQLSSLFEPDMGTLTYKPLIKSLADYAVTRLGLFAVMGTILFLVIPLYGLTRPAVKSV